MQRNTVINKTEEKILNNNNNNDDDDDDDELKQLNLLLQLQLHCCNLLRIYFLKLCVKDDLVAAVFMFELILFQIFGPKVIYFFIL